MDHIEIYKSGWLRPSWKWRLVAANGRILASGSGFNSKQGVEKSLDLIKKFFHDYKTTNK